MTEIIVDWLRNFIHTEYLLLYVLAIIPLTELRGAMILSGGMDVSHFLAFLSSVAGSSTVVIPLLLLFRPLMKWLRMTRLFKPVADMIEHSLKEKADNLEEKNKKNHNGIYVALYIFVAIPLPFTGAWTGTAIAAFVGLKFWKSVLAIVAGNFTAGFILMILIWIAKDFIDVILIAFLCILGVSLLIVFAKKWQKNRLEKAEIGRAEEIVPVDEKPVVGEFAAGGGDEQPLVVEIVTEDGELAEIKKE